MKKMFLQILVAIALFAGSAVAQTDPLAKSRLDKQGQLLTQLAKRLVAAETAIKADTGRIALADIDNRIRVVGHQEFVSMPNKRPSGLWAKHEVEETEFRTELRTELDGLDDDLGLVERAVASPKRGERKAAIREIRQNRGWR